MPRELITEQDCRVLFSDIVNGYSRDENGTFFLKHYSELDLSETEYIKRRYISSGRKEGLVSEEEKLTLLREKGHWSAEEEASYQETRAKLEEHYYSLKKLVIPQQIEHMNKMIRLEETKLREQFSYRSELLGMTLEQYATKRASESHILRSFCKDGLLQTPYFTDEDMDELTAKQMGVYIDIYHTAHDVFYERNFKKIAVCPFFLNGYNLCADNPQIFFGRPVVYLTLYQQSLFSRGRYYKNILNDPESKTPPEEYYTDLDQVIKFYDRQYSIMLGKRSGNQLIQ